MLKSRPDVLRESEREVVNYNEALKTLNRLVGQGLQGLLRHHLQQLAEQLDEEGIPVPETRGSPWFDDHEPSPFTLSAEPVHRADPKVGRNAPCPCGSGKKYKKCCLRKR